MATSTATATATATATTREEVSNILYLTEHYLPTIKYNVQHKQYVAIIIKKRITVRARMIVLFVLQTMTHEQDWL